MRRMDLETLESQVRELRRQKNNAEEELDNASERWRLERRKLKADIDQLEHKLSATRAGAPDNDGGAAWEQERERLKAQVLGLEASLAENIAQSERVRRESESRIQELAQQNEILKRELEGMTVGRSSTAGGSMVDAIEVRFQSEDSSIDAEMQRVQEAIRGIEDLLEHPDTTASMIARKNNEKAENEPYLRGLNFRLARAKSA